MRGLSFCSALSARPFSCRHKTKDARAKQNTASRANTAFSHICGTKSAAIVNGTDSPPLTLELHVWLKAPMNARRSDDIEREAYRLSAGASSMLMPKVG